MSEQYELLKISFMEDILRIVQANRDAMIVIPKWDELLSFFPLSLRIN